MRLFLDSASLDTGGLPRVNLNPPRLRVKGNSNPLPAYTQYASIFGHRNHICLRGQSWIRYSLPPPGFSESGIHLASATGKPLGFLWIHVQRFIKWANTNLDSGSFFIRCADCPRSLYASSPPALPGSSPRRLRRRRWPASPRRARWSAPS